jgi:hypothetical protein
VFGGALEPALTLALALPLLLLLALAFFKKKRHVKDVNGYERWQISKAIYQ